MEIETTVEIDEDDVLDSMSISEIEEYLENRKGYEKEGKEDLDSISATKEAIIGICAIRRKRFLIDRKTALETMTELINELF